MQTLTFPSSSTTTSNRKPFIRDVAGLKEVVTSEYRAGGKERGKGNIVVFYVGGACYMEIAAIRWMGKVGGRGITVLTDEIVNGCKVVGGFF